jgi:hypothetical protein
MAVGLPMILTGLSAATSVASGIIGMRGAQYEGQVGAANAMYSAQVARNQAAVNEWNAGLADRDAGISFENANRAGFAGQERAMTQDFSAMEQLGEVDAELASRGLSGRSQSRVISSLELLAARDRFRIREAGDAEAAQFRERASGFQSEAADLRSGARNMRSDAKVQEINASSTRKAGNMAGVASLIGGLTGAGGILLDGSRTPSVRKDFNRMFRRR